MHVLVTGGAGYIGSVSVEILLAAGHAVDVLDDLSMGHRGAVLPGATFHEGTYTDETAVARLLSDRAIDAVLHCGARSLVGESIADPARYYRQNVAGGVALLEALRAVGVRRIVFSSSAAVYGTPDESPVPEDAPLDPINPYGESKRVFESALSWYAAAYGLRSVSLRYFNAAGASAANGEDHLPETHLIANVLRAAQGNGTVTVFGDDYPTPDGTCVRDYIHVEDLARAHLLALEATDPNDSRTGSQRGSATALACNLGIGRGFSVKDVLDAAGSVVGHAIPATVGPRRPGDPPALVAAVDRARTLLGWEPRFGTLEEMIGSAWRWRQRHPAGYAGESASPTV